MKTQVPVFQSFFALFCIVHECFLHYFVLVKFCDSSIRVKKLKKDRLPLSTDFSQIFSEITLLSFAI